MYDLINEIQCATTIEIKDVFKLKIIFTMTQTQEQHLSPHMWYYYIGDAGGIQIA